jgi:hypothetical protein
MSVAEALCQGCATIVELELDGLEEILIDADTRIICDKCVAEKLQPGTYTIIEPKKK